MSTNLKPSTFQPVITTRRVLGAILVLSVLLRIGVALYLGDEVDSPPLLTDQRSYDGLGSRLVAGYGFSFDKTWYPFTPAGAPTSHWSFLYSLFVAGVYAVFGPHPLAARIVQAILGGILLPWLVYRLARRLQVADSKVEGSKVTGYRLRVADREAASHGTTTTFQPSTFQPSTLPQTTYQPSTLQLSTIPLIAAALAAIYTYFILYAATLMTETFYMCALLWSLERALALVQALRNPPAGVVPSPSASHQTPDAGQLSTFNLQLTTSLGISLGLATLLRQSILPWVAVMYLYILCIAIVRHRHTTRHGATSAKSSIFNFQSLIVIPFIVLLFVAPFTIRNYLVYDDFLLLNSNAGFAMYSAQHPMHGGSFQEFASAPLPDDLAGKGLNEAQWDKELMRRGIGFVLAEPGRYLRLSLSRVRDYFEFWPTPDTSLINNIGRVGSFGLFLPFMLYGIYLAVRPARPDSQNLQPATCNSSRIFNLQSSIFNLSFIAFYSILHIFTWAMPRYRLPVDAVALPFAALALWTLAARILRRRS